MKAVGIALLTAVVLVGLIVMQGCSVRGANTAMEPPCGAVKIEPTHLYK